MVSYRHAEVHNLKIFYREAGKKDSPTIVLLHGFPTSSFMFRNLIPLLAKTNHVIAPDYPGFGFSDAPSVDDFEYTFDHLASVVEAYLKDLPNAQLHLLETGHFALEEDLDFIAGKMNKFLS